MPLLFHLSDLHFGPRFNAHLSDLLLQDIVDVRPDLTIISGDFTMRGRVGEYEEARAYLQKIPPPVLTVPGNHDQPLYMAALLERLRTPWARYTTYIHNRVDASVELPGMFIVGINDNHPVVPGGIWSTAQRRWMTSEFERAPADACKVLVMHHQLYWDGKLRPFGKWFPTQTLNWLKSIGVELILNGHTHVPVTVRTAQGIVIAQSGTAMSGRVRHGHGNTYNRIQIRAAELTVELWGYAEDLDRFVLRRQESLARSGSRQEMRA